MRRWPQRQRLFARKLPLELEDLIFEDFAGPLTCFLCRRPSTAASTTTTIVITDHDARELWIDALRIGFRRLEILPPFELAEDDWHAMVEDKDYFSYIVRHHLALTPRWSTRQGGRRWKDRATSSYLPAAHDILHVAMRRVWTDFIDSPEFRDLFNTPFWRLWMCFVHGHASLLDHLLSDPERAAAATAGFNIERISQSHRHFQVYMNVLDAAALGGYLDVIHILYKHQPSFNAGRSMSFAGGGGSIPVLRWFHENHGEESGNLCGTDLMDWSAFAGKLDSLRFLHENRTEGCTTFAMDSAAANGHLHVVRWLQENHPAVGCTTDAMDLAAENGHLDVLKFLHENRPEGCTRRAFTRAAREGHVDVVAWLLDAIDANYQQRCLRASRRLFDARVKDYLDELYPSIESSPDRSPTPM